MDEEQELFEQKDGENLDVLLYWAEAGDASKGSAPKEARGVSASLFCFTLGFRAYSLNLSMDLLTTIYPFPSGRGRMIQIRCTLSTLLYLGDAN